MHWAYQGRFGRMSLLFLLLLVLLAVVYVKQDRLTSVMRTSSADSRPPATAPSVNNFMQRAASLTLSADQRRRYRDLIWLVEQLFRRHSIPYFMVGGSAIGALRHGGIAPFDDDFDVALEEDHQSRLRDIVAKDDRLEMVELPRYTKIFHRPATPSAQQSGEVVFPKRGYRWPWVDVYPMKSNGTHLSQNYKDPFSDLVGLKRTEIFPLKTIRFENTTVNIMRCAYTVLERKFPNFMEQCCLGSFDHRQMRKISDPPCVSCRQLESAFPFVSESKRMEYAKTFGC